jgi:lipid A 3-O-deacylase
MLSDQSRGFRIAGALLLLIVGATHVTSSRAADGKDSTFTFLLENDFAGGTDQHYTNGLELAYLSVEDDVFDWFKAGSNWLPFVDESDALRVGFSLGQSIFTPDDTQYSDPLPEQRPYAGWLYVGAAVVASQANELDTYVLNIGVVGPSAYGEDVQNGFHDWLRDEHAKGWDNQLRDTLGYQLLFEHRWRNVTGRKEMGPLQLDLSPHVGFSLGNIATYANAGVTLRLGTDLRDDFGVPRIRPSLPGSAYFEPRDGFAWYVFAGIDARAIAYNIFIEGDPATYERTLRKETFVYDGQAGFAVLWRRFRFAYTYVVRSHEFKHQEQPDRFGSLGLSYRF